MYSLVIVDDETYILEHLGSAFRWDEMGFTLAGSYANRAEALSFIRRNHVDVLLTDIQLGDDSGLRLAAEARELWPDIELVILSAYSDFEYARTALRINVYDYFLKPVTHESVTVCFSGLKKKLDTLRSEGSHTISSSGDYRIDLVKNYIDKHVGEDITLENTAGLISMNPAYFSRFFKQRTGTNFADYLAGRRMEKAIELLRDPKYRVFEICTMVGYFSKQNFYKRFRQHTSRTPVEYRNEVLKITDIDDEE